MAKNILIVYDYERIVPPFMQSLIKIGSKRFDEIYYITPPIPEYYQKTIDLPNVNIVVWTKKQRFLQYLHGILSIFRPRFWKECTKGHVSIGAIKNIGQMFFCSDGFINMSENIIKKKQKEGNHIYLLSTWMGVDAFVSARMKHKYPDIKAYALAHSGEVMAERNPYIFQCFHEYKHQYLDKTYFISKKVLDGYLKYMEPKNIAEQFSSRISVHYLGCIKNDNRLNPPNKSDIFHLLSCSRIDNNKRLDKIISALRKWNKGKLKWTHIGTGVMAEEIKVRAEELSKNNPFIEINFTGRLDNPEVINYYANIPVDLFLNVSRSEGLPISIMEAMSYGIPCAATDVGGTAEIVNSTNGYLLDENFTDEDLISTITTYRDLSTDQKNIIRHAAYKTWESLFNAEQNANKLYDEWLA